MQHQLEAVDTCGTAAPFSRFVGLRIALLEDDMEQAESTASLLRNAGHQMMVFTHGRVLLRQLNKETYDLIMLDSEVSDVCGHDLLRRIRDQLSLRTPVLLLTHRGSEEDVARALEARADDFLVKPPRERELLARVDALGRRFHEGAPHAQVIELPPFRIDAKQRKIEREGVTLKLTRREFEVAALLFRNLDKVLSRGHIMQAVWGQSAATTTRTVDMHVSRVRKVLGLSNAIGLRLTAIYGHGYRLEHAETTAT